MRFLIGLLAISLTMLSHAGHQEGGKISKAAKVVRCLLSTTGPAKTSSWA